MTTPSSSTIQSTARPVTSQARPNLSVHASLQLKTLKRVVKVATERRVGERKSSKCPRSASKIIVLTGQEPPVPRFLAPATALEIGVGPAIGD